MPKPVVMLGVLLAAACALCLVCGTWVSQAHLHIRDGVEYQIAAWQWQWHSPMSIARALGALGLVAAVCWLAVGRGWMTAPPLATAPARTINQRRFSRYACAWPVRYQLRGLPFERQAACVNISEGGMQCVMQEGWVRNTPLELRVLPPDADAFVVHGTVRWVRTSSAALPSLGEGLQHRVGIRFEPERSAHVGALLRLLLSSGGLKLV